MVYRVVSFEFREKFTQPLVNAHKSLCSREYSVVFGEFLLDCRSPLFFENSGIAQSDEKNCIRQIGRACSHGDDLHSIDQEITFENEVGTAGLVP